MQVIVERALILDITPVPRAHLHHRYSQSRMRPFRNGIAQFDSLNRFALALLGVHMLTLGIASLSQADAPVPTKLPNGSLYYDPPQNVVRKPNKILLIHGGGLIGGSPQSSRYQALAKQLAQEGYETLSLRYLRLWEGGTEATNQPLFDSALTHLNPTPETPITIVSLSAGSWVGLKALEGHLESNCPKSHTPFEFVGISPMVEAESHWITRTIARLYQRNTKKTEPHTPHTPHTLTPIQEPIRTLLIRGKNDPIISSDSLRSFCSDPLREGPTDASQCQTIELSGGHQLITREISAETPSIALIIEFLAESN